MAKDLKHIGILGMKWGVRKAKGPSSSDHIMSRELRKKGINELSNDEIRKITTRLQLEKQIKDLNDADQKKGREFLQAILNGPIGKIALGLIVKKAKDAFNKRTGFDPSAANPEDVVDALLLEERN